MRLLLGREHVLRKDVDLKTEHWCGWDIFKQLLHEGDVLYSFGVADDIGFERKACEASVCVFAFDPTPYSVNWIAEQNLPPRDQFRFYPPGGSGKRRQIDHLSAHFKKRDRSSVMYTLQSEGNDTNEGVEVEARTISSIAGDLAHESVEVLKLDIEGAEYEVVDSMLSSSFRPRILLIEFHHRFKSTGAEKTLTSVRKLREAGYRVAHVSITNRELCFAHESRLR